MLSFPKNILKTIEMYLTKQKKEIEGRLVNLKKEDPYTDTDRLMDNAANDTEAYEEIGHERVMALQHELSDEKDKIEGALRRIKFGKYGYCIECKKLIDKARLEAIPMAELCVTCEQKKSKHSSSTK